MRCPILKGIFLINMKKNGFTLIELLVSITILLLIVGGGIVSYITFNEKQQLSGAAKELQGYFRSAQTRVRNGDVPDGCGKLSGYQVTVANGSSSVNLLAVCSGPGILPTTYTLGGSVAPSSAIDVTFLGLHGGVTGAQTITLTKGDRSYSFKVTAGGEITQGDFDEEN